MESLRFTSPLQRFENLLLLRLKFPEADGWREEILVGLLRKTSLQARNLETPLIREKMQAIFEARQMRPYSYNYNEAIRILSGMPKFALFRAPTAELLQIIDTLLFIDEKPDSLLPGWSICPQGGLSRFASTRSLTKFALHPSKCVGSCGVPGPSSIQ